LGGQRGRRRVAGSEGSAGETERLNGFICGTGRKEPHKCIVDPRAIALQEWGSCRGARLRRGSGGCSELQRTVLHLAARSGAPAKPRDARRHPKRAARRWLVGMLVWARRLRARVPQRVYQDPKELGHPRGPGGSEDLQRARAPAPGPPCRVPAAPHAAWLRVRTRRARQRRPSSAAASNERAARAPADVTAQLQASLVAAFGGNTTG
jgi:hypothetical protein